MSRSRGTLTFSPLRWFCSLRREHPFFAMGLLALFALAVGLVAHALVPSSVRADNADYSSFYGPVAESIIEGHGPTINNHLAIRYPIGFPLLVAGALGTARAFSLPVTCAEAALPLICLAISSVILFLTAELIHGTAWALLSYFLWICCPWVLYLSAKPLSDIPFCCFLFASTYFLFKFFKAGELSLAASVGTGLLIGASMLVRPIGMFIAPIAAVLVLVLTRTPPLQRRLTIAALLVVGTAIPVVPWEVWLYNANHGFLLLSTGSTPVIRDGLAFASNSADASGTNRHFIKRYRQGIAVPIRAQQVSADARNNYASLASTGAILDFLSKELHHNAIGVTQLYLVKAARSWYGSDSQAEDARVLGVQILFLGIISVGVWGSWRIGSYCRACTILCLAFVLYFWAMTTFVLSILRYMTPAMGLLFLLVPGWRQLLQSRYRLTSTSAEAAMASTYSHS